MSSAHFSRYTGQFDVDGDGRWDLVDALGRVGLAANQPTTAVFTTLERPGVEHWDIGDINGDGYSDILAVDPAHENHRGTAWVYLAPLLAPLASASQTIEPPTGANSSCGTSVSAGDFNGDGFNDVAIGCDAFGESRGVVFVYYGSTTALTLGAPTRIDSFVGVGWRFGARASADLDVDGIDDLIAGAPASAPERGAVAIYRGTSTSVERGYSWLARATSEEQAAFGASANAGDFDGTGHPQLVVAGSTRGCLHWLSGSGSGAAGWTTTRSWCVRPGTNVRSFERTIAVGDFDGDGRSDLAGRIRDNSTGDINRLAVYYGARLAQPDGGREERDLPQSAPECHPPRAADVNGDGYADVIVCAGGQTSSADIRVFRGSAQGLSATSEVITLHR